MKKAVILTGEKVQDHEFIYPYYRLKEAGFKIIVTGRVTILGTITTGILGTKIPPDDECNIYPLSQYYGEHRSTEIEKMQEMINSDLLLIPGGAKCMEYLRQEPKCIDLIKMFNTKEKIIASICHGAQMLISAKVVKGRKISGYYSIKDDINNAGAEYVDAPSVRDGNIITCPHYKHMGEWMAEVLKAVNENSSN